MCKKYEEIVFLSLFVKTMLRHDFDKPHDRSYVTLRQVLRQIYVTQKIDFQHFSTALEDNV